MRKELHEISMKRWDNPKTLFSQIVTIETRYRGRCEPLKDSDKLHALRDALPQQYQWTILSQEQAAEDNGTTVCLKKLRKGLSNVYDMEQNSKFGHQKKGKEISLYAGEAQKKGGKVGRNSKTTDKKCFSCGKKGHFKRECPTKNTKVCSACNKKGHDETSCWEKYPEKKPKWLKIKDKNNNKQGNDSDEEVAGIVVDNELAVMRIDVEDDSDEEADEVVVKRTCWNCGQEGHKKWECENKRNRKLAESAECRQCY